MRLLIIAAMLSLLAGTSLATVDTGPNQIGMYFDNTADEVCLDGVTYGGVFIIYMVITNPTSDVNGIELSYCVEAVGGSVVVADAIWSPALWPPMGAPDFCTEGWTLSASYPVPQVEANVVLCEFTYLLMADQVNFYIGPVANQSIDDGLPAYLGAGNEMIALGVSTGDPSLPVAMVNGPCGIVAAEGMSFDSVKALYR